MKESTPDHSFLGLPISAEQEAEIRHYIRRRHRSGLPADKKELRAMLCDMINVPSDDGVDRLVGVEIPLADLERAAAAIDEAMDAESVSEERHAACEAEAMKHS